jgi:hypothetical protein
MKWYTVCCHGCGKIYDKHAITLALPMSITGPDGNSYGVRACDECADTDNKIVEAYEALVSGTFDEYKKENWK